MISFQYLGQYGRFGNQLFQYAFLRTRARALGVPFYCPPWVGDQVFLLGDRAERALRPEGIVRRYIEPIENCGYSESSIQIQDGTDIVGHFQSERCFDRPEVLSWYRFRPEAVEAVVKKYATVDWKNRAGLHLRFGDKKYEPQSVIAPPSYYRRALSLLGEDVPLAVFSDEPHRAKRFLKKLLRDDTVFFEGNRPHEDLFLMTRCRHFVCSVSTLSWWGAWLREGAGKTIHPREWIRPGYHRRSEDLSCAGWTELRCCPPVFGHYRVAHILHEVDRCSQPLRRFVRNLLVKALPLEEKNSAALG